MPGERCKGKVLNTRKKFFVKASANEDVLSCKSTAMGAPCRGHVCNLSELVVTEDVSGRGKLVRLGALRSSCDDVVSSVKAQHAVAC